MHPSELPGAGHKAEEFDPDAAGVVFAVCPVGYDCEHFVDAGDGRGGLFGLPDRLIAERYAAAPAANAALAACAKPNAPSICTMLPQQKSQQQPSPALYGYPSAPEFLGRVSGTQYTETAVNALQALYFVVAEDSSGDLSSPSNVVGGPSFYRSSN